MNQILVVSAGVVLLLVGRKLFWLFVGLVGFLFGLHITPIFFPEQPLIGFAVGIPVGIVSALLAIFLKRLAFALGGFYAGGYLGLVLAKQLEMVGYDSVWFVAMGLVAAVFAVLLMDWAIIILSALAGAAAIVSSVGFLAESPLNIVVFIVLLLVGCAVQGRSYEGPPPS